ncbi:MAG TPA: hypothetical protein PLZ38_11480, partial [Spirochaetota bacterium]|nr:hypothetical protein [Spirochaetota bacterium]
MKCKKCGNKIPLLIEICPYCGYEFHATHHKNVHNDNANTAEDAVHDDRADDTQKILNDIKNIKNYESNNIGSIAILIISILLFFSIGYAKHPLKDTIIVIIVLLLHEFGHLLGMMIFKYKNIKMFFIPFFGAAVSGLKLNKDGFNEAIISLLGPMPGILIAIACMFFFKNNDNLNQIAASLIFINGFNLLPIYPLDGGRIMDIIFQRSMVAQLLFRIVTSLALIYLAVFSHTLLLAFVGIIIILSIPDNYRTNKAVKALKADIPATVSIENEDKVLQDNIGIIYATVKAIFPKVKGKRYANIILAVWDKLTFKAPNFIKSLII